MEKMSFAAALVKVGLKLPGDTVGGFGAMIKLLTPADRQWFIDRLAKEYGIEVVSAI